MCTSVVVYVHVVYTDARVHVRASVYACASLPRIALTCTSLFTCTCTCYSMHVHVQFKLLPTLSRPSPNYVSLFPLYYLYIIF